MKRGSPTSEQLCWLGTSTTTKKTSDLQNSKRFSLKREAENTVKEDISTKAEVSTILSQDFFGICGVCYTGVDQVTEKIRTQETTRIIETFEEEEGRTFDNTGKAKNISGIYHWVKKTYKAQGSTTANGFFKVPTSSKPPPSFTDLPSLSIEKNDSHYYGRYLAIYDVEGLQALPFDNITVAKTFVATGDDNTKNKGAELKILDNYRVVNVHVSGAYNFTDEDNNGMNVFVGDQSFQW
ncbi:hypothetical protein ABW20_dc0110136 [Dactylellina cionopaga]|nr:hypothetical protein ABW20_dc0110136 [Dactylellina cionopaga]